MNSLSKNLLIFFVLAFAFANSSFAQQVDENTATVINQVKGQTEVTAINSDLIIANTDMPKSVITEYPKLMKRFSMLYPAQTNQQWTENNNMLFVSFMYNGYKTRACFTKNGMLNYEITDCNLPQLPAGLQQHIKAKYSGYTVFNAIEINAYNTTAHQVILENTDGFITIKSTNEGIEETGKLSK